MTKITSLELQRPLLSKQFQSTCIFKCQKCQKCKPYANLSCRNEATVSESQWKKIAVTLKKSLMNEESMQERNRVTTAEKGFLSKKKKLILLPWGGATEPSCVFGRVGGLSSGGRGIPLGTFWGKSVQTVGLSVENNVSEVIQAETVLFSQLWGNIVL